MGTSLSDVICQCLFVLVYSCSSLRIQSAVLICKLFSKTTDLIQGHSDNVSLQFIPLPGFRHRCEDRDSDEAFQAGLLK